MGVKNYRLYKCRGSSTEAWEDIVAERPGKAASQYADDYGLVQGDVVEVDDAGAIKRFSIFQYRR